MPPARLAAALLTLIPTLLAQAPEPPVPTIRTTARLVVLDVVVSDGQGLPIRGLKPSDFGVFEDNKSQHLLSVTEHDTFTDAPIPTDDLSSASGPLPPNTFTGHPPLAGDLPKTVIVLDNLAFPDAPVFREQLQAFLRTLPPNTPIALFRIDWQGLHLIQDFTQDPAALLAAVNSRRMLPPAPFRVRYYRLTTPPVVELAHLLAPIPGRINLVWVGSLTIPVSGPAPDSLFADSEALPSDAALSTAALAAAPNALRIGRIALYPIDARGLVGNYTPSDLLNGTTGGVLANGEALVSSCQALREAAFDTGGKGFCGTNNLSGALTEAVTRGSHYYTLSYAPHNPHWNGAFRHIRIDVGDALRETALERAADWVNFTPRVVYRNGYYARDPDRRSPGLLAPAALSPSPPSVTDSAAGTEAPVRKLLSYSPKGDPHLPGNTRITPTQLAMNFTLSAAPWDLPFKLTVTPSPETYTLPSGAPPPAGNFVADPWRAEPYRTLTLHYSLDPQDFQFSPHDGLFRNQFELVALVFRDDSALVNSAALTVPVDVGADDLARIDRTGMAFEQSLALPAAGNFYLRVGVREVNSGRIGVLSIPTEWIQANSRLGSLNDAAPPTR